MDDERRALDDWLSHARDEDANDSRATAATHVSCRWIRAEAEFRPLRIAGRPTTRPLAKPQVVGPQTRARVFATTKTLGAPADVFVVRPSMSSAVDAEPWPTRDGAHKRHATGRVGKETRERALMSALSARHATERVADATARNTIVARGCDKRRVDNSEAARCRLLFSVQGSPPPPLLRPLAGGVQTAPAHRQLMSAKCMQASERVLKFERHDAINRRQR